MTVSHASGVCISPPASKTVTGQPRQVNDSPNPITPESVQRRLSETSSSSPWSCGRAVQPPTLRRMAADARAVPLPDRSVDLVVTSPPYWLKRDYGVPNQIGQEASPQEYVDNLTECMKEWRRLLPVWGSVFINIGDTYQDGALAAIPGRLEIAAQSDNWVLRNRIVWAKDAGMPDPAKHRLTNRHEYIMHFAVKRRGYYYDQFGYATKYGNGTCPSDVWKIALRRDAGRHLAPFPDELVDRALTLACPLEVCSACGEPRRRVVRRTKQLNPDRPQARRAMELAEQAGLSDDHIAAIQATGISDAGKAMKTQNGTGRNAERVQKLAAEAKLVLGGYFREFTFAKRATSGWTSCSCRDPLRPGVVLDPFMGTGTTLRAAIASGRSAIGVDLCLDFT